MDIQEFADVFAALADTPAEAANMKVRSDVLSALTDRVRSWQVRQDQEVACLGITHPRLNDLVHGKLSKFSLDALVNLTAAAGMTLEIRVAA